MNINEDKIVNSLQTDNADDRQQGIKKVPWAFTAGELIKKQEHVTLTKIRKCYTNIQLSTFPIIQWTTLNSVGQVSVVLVWTN